MTYTKRSLKNIEKQDVIIIVLNVQTECDRLVELIGKHIDELSYKVDELTLNSLLQNLLWLLVKRSVVPSKESLRAQGFLGSFCLRRKIDLLQIKLTDVFFSFF